MRNDRFYTLPEYTSKPVIFPNREGRFLGINEYVPLISSLSGMIQLIEKNTNLQPYPIASKQLPKHQKRLNIEFSDYYNKWRTTIFWSDHYLFISAENYTLTEFSFENVMISTKINQICPLTFVDKKVFLNILSTSFSVAFFPSVSAGLSSRDNWESSEGGKINQLSIDPSTVSHQSHQHQVPLHSFPSIVLRTSTDPSPVNTNIHFLLLIRDHGRKFNIYKWFHFWTTNVAWFWMFIHRNAK